MCSSFVFVGLNSEQGFKGPEESRRWKLPVGSWKPSIRGYYTEEWSLEKDKILLSLVDRLKTSEAKLNTQVEAHKAEVEDLKKKIAEINENFEVAKAKQEISEMERARVQKNIEELRDSKEKCYEVSMECAKKLKDSFSKVGAYSSEQKIICGDPEGVIQWIGEEAEAFEEILSDRGDFYAFTGPWGIATILEKTGCEHVKAAA
jgi:seryl-tRNA synthetase